ncbi:MAG: GSCFA domain-containing protein [Bacteroidetes bacterium]|nr:GSCFA domain-containing protein [Candidatus Colenecus caballi]
MKLQTPVEIKPLEKRFTYHDSMLLVGSCFAQEIGRRLEDRYFDVHVNPFGVLFNPCSIADCLGLLEGYGINSYGCSFIPEDVIETSGGFCSFHHHGSFARPTPQQFLDEANEKLAFSSDFFYRKGWVAVTLGTAYVYKDKETGQVVSNCHKLPQDRFEREMLNVDQVYEMLNQYIPADPERQWIFTVSPVRHLADGLHENQLSKSTLLLGVQKLVQRYPNAHYFPAYEIMMDELRDYRFYADDMMHPSRQAADYVFERFMDWILADEERADLKEAERIHGMMEHRPLNPETQAAKDFEVKRKEALDNFIARVRL